jgi:hypothetical protein
VGAVADALAALLAGREEILAACGAVRVAPGGNPALAGVAPLGPATATGSRLAEGNRGETRECADHPAPGGSVTQESDPSVEPLVVHTVGLLWAIKACLSQRTALARRACHCRQRARGKRESQ